MSDVPVLRFAQPSDIDALVRLCQEHARFERADYCADGKPSLLTQQLFSDAAPLKCIVAQFDGELIGYVSFMRQFSTWDCAFYLYMDCLFLTAQARGKGLGELIMTRLKREAVDLQCSHIQWQTPSFNTRAIKFYQRIGASAKEKQRFFLDLH